LNQWIASAVAQKVGVVETAAEFFQKARPECHWERDDEISSQCTESNF